MSEEWQTYKLEDVLEALIDYRGKTPKKTNAGIPLITAKIVKNGTIMNPKEFISEKDYDTWMVRGLPKSGDVVLTTEAPLGEVAQLINSNVALAQRIVTLRGKANVLDNGFLKYFLMSNIGQSKLKERESGTTVTGIKQSELRLVEINMPDYHSQKGISKILSSIDEKIELNNAINKNLEEMAQALFKRWFVDFEFPNENDEPYKSSGGEFKESELGLIPKDWKVSSLDEIIEINPKISLKKGSAHPYVEMKNITNHYVRVTEHVIRDFSAGSKFINGDVLLARITPCLENGKTAYVDFLEKDQVGWGSTEFIILRSRKNIPGEFTYFLARSDLFRSHAISNMTGSSGRQRVPDSSLRNYPISLPDNNDNILAFGEIARSVLGLMKKNDEESKRLTSIRHILLPKLMSGEIRVPVEREYTQAVDLPMVAESSEKYSAH
ncbi:hypothetical protein BSK59_28840 [Paenibacillus odorifer]|nr:hypothetical protein BSK59_28840 [Paenibacillus odorifer]